MTLLITLFAAILATAAWYISKAKIGTDKFKLSILCHTYWGASIMWLVDAIFEYAELKAEYFTPSFFDMVNDAFLGVSAVTLGLVIWLGFLLLQDPFHVLKKA